MRIYDISMPIHPNMVTWPGDPPVTLEEVSSLDDEGAIVSRLGLGTHTGTHIDAPRHMLLDGAGVDAYSLERLIGPARVVHLPDATRITDKDLYDAEVYDPVTRVLLRTANSDRGLLRGSSFSEDYVTLDSGAAMYLGVYGIRLVGIDALSVDSYQAGAGSVHRTLLEEGIAVLEGLNLADVPAGEYWLVCLPLALVGADGAPARAVLVDFQDERMRSALLTTAEQFAQRAEELRALIGSLVEASMPQRP